jgi:exopolyphosphatase/guanosine-5'-triphosphate,3'-diphosphate pyrophosphatase
MAAVVRPVASPETAVLFRQAIIDIGSNSIRLVIYQGGGRVPDIIFNEKVLAGLGRGVAESGRLHPAAIERAMTALRRFTLLIRDMGVSWVRTVATAAVRDAANGAEFLAAIRSATHLEVELLSGEDEARVSALGVLAGIPGAQGVMGDLGGGSLELVRIAGGKPVERLSLPIGSLRMAAMAVRDSQTLRRLLAKALRDNGWKGVGAGEPFYMVGGSWRALAQLHMHVDAFPLPIIHQYVMPADAPSRLTRVLAHTAPKRLKAATSISTSRIATLPSAAALLGAVTRLLGSSRIVASAYGLREGLMFDAMPPELRALDPLTAAARAEGERQGRFAEHGDLLDAWMAGLFADDSAEDRRLRHVACLLADVGWRAHPDYRAERGMDTALHGNWVGVDARGRALMAAALHANFGGRSDSPEMLALAPLATPAEFERARCWGLALRLGQRISGGSTEGLVSGGLSLDRGVLSLALPADQKWLYGEAVVRRHKALASALGAVPKAPL